MRLALPKLTRRRFAASLLAAGLGAGAWMRFVEPWWMKVTRRDVPLGLGGKQLRVLHLGDFHADPMPLPFLRDTIHSAVALQPDLICLTGDYITWKYAQWDEYAVALGTLAQTAPTFAVLGNHDGGGWSRHHGYADTTLVRGLLAKAGARLLHNASETIELRGQRLQLVGLGDWWADEMEPREAFAGVKPEPGVPVVLLSHNPDTKDRLAAHPWDLMLSGHTHGGQLSLPGLGEPFAPIRDKRYVRDLHRWQDRWLYITAGVGALHSLRFNCRPEISLLMLV